VERYCIYDSFMLSPNGRLRCPLCRTMLRQVGPRYTIDELFEMWDPIRFSDETVREHRAQSDFTIEHACPSCGLEIFLPQIIGTSRFYVEAYGLIEERKEPRFTYSESKWDFDEGLKDAKTCASLIEIGCGAGYFLQQVRPYVGRVCGTETNDQALRIARSKGLRVFGADEDVNLTGQMDAAFSFHVLEHVADPVAFLQLMRAWVKPGGRMGISVPNQDGPIRHIDPCIHEMPPHHATHWRLKTLQVAAERLRLEIDRVAFEPLTADNSYYYSTYWPKSVFPAKAFPANVVRKGVSLLMAGAFAVLFGALRLFGKRSIATLRGQSIYVLMSKPCN
jgi:SAM-dependent methyltransferase